METYQAVLFDMFDTLVNFSRALLPLIRLDGQEVRSTSLCVYEAMRPIAGHVPPETFARAFLQSHREIEAIRNGSHREVTVFERFQRLLVLLGIAPGLETAAVVEAGIAEHLRQLGHAMEFPESHRVVLDRLRRRYRLGVVSNFDHGPAVERILAGYGILDRFEMVVVSGDIGWCKPRPEIFVEGFRRMGITAEEAIFIGDTPESDVLGAQALGMDVIWIDHGTAALPPGTPRPAHTVASFVEVADLLVFDCSTP
jgi:HAD superfamily hydrolase (TIGR01509 family)